MVVFGLNALQDILISIPLSILLVFYLFFFLTEIFFFKFWVLLLSIGNFFSSLGHTKCSTCARPTIKSLRIKNLEVNQNI